MVSTVSQDVPWAQDSDQEKESTNLLVHPALRTETRASARGYVQATKPRLLRKAEAAVGSMHLESQDNS